MIWGWITSVDARIWQAAIAGGFVSIGWIVNGRANRRRDRRLRQERLRDVHRALYAEIGTNLSNLRSASALSDDVAQMEQRMEAEPDFVPFLPQERTDRVFSEIVGEIHILPRVTIDPVVAYYAQVGAISALVEDMRADGYAALSPGRRLAIYRDLMEMKRQALTFGGAALRLIEVYAAEGKDAAEAAAAVMVQFNTLRGADLSDP